MDSAVSTATTPCILDDLARCFSDEWMGWHSMRAASTFVHREFTASSRQGAAIPRNLLHEQGAPGGTVHDPTPSSHAIVIGGSVVGCAAAAMLSSRFERVTILERDLIPSRPESRGGVSQGRHVHVLLGRGALELEKLFPGFLGEMQQAGAEIADVGRDVAWLTPAGWGVRFESGIRLCCASRQLIEWQVRRRALACSNVRLLDGVAVSGLLTDGGRSSVRGVRLRARRGEAHATELSSDLVVDASGRASQLTDWLQEIGRPRVRELVIDAGMAYSSRLYSIPSKALRGWRAIYVQPALPEKPSGAILFPIEADRYHLTAFGYGTAAPPTDDQGLVRFVERLRNSAIADVVREGTPLTPIINHRRTENRWRRFDEIADWPDGLMAVGDSVCCFDPVYGQGMSTGILAARALMEQIDARPAGRAHSAQRAVARVVRPAWDLATGEDLRLEHTTGGQRRFRDRILQAYLDRVIAAATADANVRLPLLRVMNMLAGPETLFNPRTVTAVVRHAVRVRTRYSAFSADSGLTDVARRAGTRQPASATISRNTAAPPKVSGSLGLTP
jgi:2-polyprenyl-6-methoxyphenol hydroxylase-like FAD-dependent oxidoreductase